MPTTTKRFPAAPTASTPASAAQPSAGARHSALRRLVTQTLDDRERLIVTLRYAEGLTPAEIGLVLDLSERRVAASLDAVRARLGAQMACVGGFVAGCDD